MYTEDIKAGNEYRHQYIDGIRMLIETKREEAALKRNERAERIIEEGEIFRKELKEMLGWPLNQCWNAEVPEVNKTFVAKYDGISIFRMQIDVLGIPFYGILFVNEDGMSRPLVITQHGGLGSPELCGGLLKSGSENYNDMVQRVLKYDVNVFAPQLLLWRPQYSFDEFKGEDSSYTNAMRLGIDRDLKQLGGSITALEIYCIQKCIDYFEKQSYVNANKIGMLGLSYGGFYTLHTAAVEKRIKCALTCSCFNDRVKYNWNDWTWKNSANMFNDSEIALLVYPRKLFIAVGNNDKMFDAETGENEFKKLKGYTKDIEWLNFERFNGEHEFIRDDEMLSEFMAHLIRD